MGIKRWLSYERKLMAIRSPVLPYPKERLSDAFLKHHLRGITEIEDYAVAFQTFANTLSFKVPEHLVFGHYAEDCTSVKVENGKYQLYYCERGGWHLEADCRDLVDLTYAIFSDILPLTASAKTTLASLDRIKDQRLILWLKMSSEIYHAFKVNEVFGERKLKENVSWMSEELVRTQVFKTPESAMQSEKHIVQGFMLGGMPKDMAQTLYRHL